jgi:CubicO group peptidase (beta-lactamase class C family)
VTPQSLFRIASNTKAFTTAALAMLVDEGKIRWDDRVIDHMPAFQMYDPYVTREMMVRDLLVHRSGLGLGAGDLMFWPSTDQFVRERIFLPLGMTSTNASTPALVAAPDVAIPHARAVGKVVPIPQSDHDNNAPAGSMNSSVADLAKWLVVQLNHGELPGGRRLFSARQSKEMWSPQTILPIADLPTGAPAELEALQPNFSAYGLGWMLRDYRGKKLVFHTGVLAGYVSRVTMVPDLKLGIVVLTNQEETGAHAAITWTVLDHYLGAPATDWVTAFRDLAKAEVAQGEAEEKKATGKRNANSRPSLPLAAYAGRYRDAWYGDVAVAEHGGKLTISFTHTRQLMGDLEHWQYDTFVARWRDRTLGADAFVTFALGPDGSIETVKMSPVSPLTDFSFDFQDLTLHPIAGGAAAR